MKNVYLMLLFLLSIPGIAQIKTVTGQVSDETKSPLPGVNILVKGTTKGTATDFDGNYTIQVNSGDILEFSFTGFTTQERKVQGSGNQIRLNVSMQEDTQQLTEVVVVAFGKQKKENLTGSVASVNTKVLEARPVASATQALQGAVPGMNFSVGNGGGELNSNLSFDIRGTGTIGSGSKASPLVLIDGMEGDINTLNPQDIESISVLKDAASSSIYGSRAPFGVILITTKSGKEGRISINYNTNLRISSPINLPKMMDSETFAYYFNEAASNKGDGAIFSNSIIDKIKLYKNGEIDYTTEWNPVSKYWGNYSTSFNNIDWFKQYYRKSAPSYEHNLSVNGGNEKTSYYLSLGWLSQEGLHRYNTESNNRYSINAKISSQILPYLRVNYNNRFVRTDYIRSSYLTVDNGLFAHNIARRWPTLPLYDPNGNLFYGNEIHQLENGKAKDQIDILSQQLAFVVTPLEGWVTNLEFNYKTENQFNDYHYLPIYRHLEHGEQELVSLNIWGASAGLARAREEGYKSNFFNTNLYTSYEKQLGDHYLKGMVGFQSELQKTRKFSAYRDGLYSPNVIAINAAGSSNDEVSGERQHWATAGFFGRINYNYKSKYLAEFNLRYDGTSRFLRDQRWNVFTSASLGWNIAKENFWASLGKFGEAVPEFKLRGSYGELGNQNTDNWYPFFTKMKLGASNGTWLINGQKPNTASAPDLVSEFLTWEKVSSWNAGFDLSALDNRLNVVFDIFQRNTHNMVGPAPELPSTLGTNPPRINNTDMISRGFEVQVTWRDKIGDDFSYGITGTLTDSRQKVTRYPNQAGLISQWYSGRYSGEIWGYTTHGIAKTDAEMNQWLTNHNQSQLGSNWAAGDIMYEDLNGDGVINEGKGTLADSGDLSIIGNSTPRYNFGLNLDMKYKNFDFSIFLQGVGKRDLDLRGVYFGGANTGMWQSSGFTDHLDYFRPENTTSPFGANVNAYYPRPLFEQGEKNFKLQTRWLQNGAYMRVKNIQFGYSLPSDVCEVLGITKLRFYASVENAFTFTKLSNIFDPEATRGRWGNEPGKLYPLSRVFATGLNLTF